MSDLPGGMPAPAADPASDDTLVIALKEPIALGSLPAVSQIKLVEPTVQQVETALREPTFYTADIVLCALVTGLDPNLIRKLRSSDFMKARAFLRPFLALPEAMNSAVS